MILSILICSIYERAGMLASLLRELHKQIDECGASDKVEVLIEIDNKGIRTTGSKRNSLYQRAIGKYSTSIDDDDSIAPYFIEELLRASESDMDCFAINGTMTTNGIDERKWCISLHNSYITKIEDGKESYYRYPNHICPIKTSIAKQVLFPDIFVGEDYEWATKIHNKKLLTTEYKIERPIYHYKFINPKN